MSNGIYIFEDKEDFLKAIDELNSFYNSERTSFTYLHKHLNHVFEARNEVEFLKKCHVLTYSCFRKDSIIKVSFKDSQDKMFNMTYSFNNS